MRKICTVAALVGLVGLGTHGAQAQGIAESGMMNSNSAIAAHSAKAPSIKIPKSANHTQSTPKSSATAQSAETPSRKIASPADKNRSPFLMERTGPPPDEVNRRNFEEHAGLEAGKLLLRSVPNGADVFLNNLLVGRTPLLMLVAPGKYQIDMRGTRQESGHRSVGLMPKESQTVLIYLGQRYPTSVSIP